MAYLYRVTLSGIKGFYRVYKMSASSTLYAFHKQMRADMEFPADQLILFKGLDAGGNVVARYGLFDLGDGAADQVSVSDTARKGIVSFVYFYDVTNRKSVIVALEGETAEKAGAPVLIDSKGPDPIDFENGYVAFEDLPDSQRHLPGQKPDWLSSLGAAGDDGSSADGDDDDEEDDDDEDGKEVFDGTEDLSF